MTVTRNEQQAPCVLCGESTEVIVNTAMQAKPMCIGCCLSITQQMIRSLSVQGGWLVWGGNARAAVRPATEQAPTT